MLTIEKISDLLKYFNQEMSYLISKGKEFSEQHPKIARFLEINEEGSSDPHVQRLIESVAFLTAQMKREINKNFPEYTHQLLRVLHPHLVAPIPSTSVVHLDMDLTQAVPPTGFHVPKKTKLFLNSENDTLYQFQTCYDTTLWPISIKTIDILDESSIGLTSEGSISKKALRIRLESHGTSFKDLNLNSLDFFIHGSPLLAHRLYDALCAENTPIYVWNPKTNTPITLPALKILPLGFEQNYQCIPQQETSHPSYGNLIDYFSIPSKYLFFKLNGIPSAFFDDVIDLIIPIEMHEAFKQITKDTLCLGCTPVINLFEKTTEPLKLDHTQFKYKLTPDIRYESTTEIHSIQKVFLINSISGETSEIPNFFNHTENEQSKTKAQISWYIEKEPSKYEGFDTYMSFVDTNFDPQLMQNATIFAETICSNRISSHDIPDTASLHSFTELPVKNIRLKAPFSQQKTIIDTENSYWGLLKHLTVNHTSLMENNGQGLRDILTMYANPLDLHWISGINNIEQEFVSRRLNRNDWRGFIQGIQITITLDQDKFKITSPLIFGGVLRQFLGMYTTLNSFIELQFKWKQTGEIWKKWPPISGRQHLV